MLFILWKQAEVRPPDNLELSMIEPSKESNKNVYLKWARLPDGHLARNPM